MKQSKLCCGVMIVLCMIFFNGCNSELPLNHRMIVQNAGVDIENGKVTVSLNAYLADRTAAGEKGSGSDVFFSQSGISVSDAAEQIGTVSGKSPYFPHNQAIVIGHKTAENGLGRVLNFFAEYHECRGAVPLFVAQESAEDLLKSVGKEGSIPARELASLSKLGHQSGNSVNTEVITVMQCLHDASRDFCIPMLCLEQTNEEAPRIKLGATALFSGDKMVAELDEEQTKGVLIASETAKLISVDLSVPNQNGKPVAVRVAAQQFQTKIKTQGNGDRANIQMEVKCSLMPTEWEYSVTQTLDQAFAGEVLRRCEQQLTRAIERAVQACFQQYGADPFGFGRHLAQQQPQWWQQYGNRWKTLLKNCEISVLVRGTLQSESF